MSPKEKQTLKKFLPQSKPVESRKTSNNKQGEDKTMLHLLRFGIVVAIIIVAGLLFTAWGTYAEGWQNYFVDSVNKIVPFPAVSVGYGNWVTINEYNENVKAMRRFLESKEAAYGGGNFDFSTPDGLKRLAIIKKNILNQLIEGKMIEIIAKKQNISVTDAELADTTSKIINRDGKQAENIAQLNVLYGWTTEDFKQRVVKNLLYQQKLEDKIKANGELDKKARKKLETVKEKIAAGTNFSDIAKEYSDSPSKQYGGTLPAFSRDNAPQIISDAAFKLGAGQVSEPIKGEDGWHIIKLEKKFNESGKEKVEVSHILIKNEELKDWVRERKDEFKVSVYLKPYYWHDQMGRLYFKDDALNQTEQEWDRSYLNEKTQETDFLLNTGKTSNP